MRIYKVESTTDQSLRKKITDLLMIKLENVGASDADERINYALDLILEEDSPAHMFVAEIDNIIVGLAFYNIAISIKKGGYYIWLNDLFVHKDYRNKSIARKMILKLVYWAENEDIKGIELETGINNEATKALYNSLGFYDIVSKRYGFRY
jgi:GNAT superfamily N-acetyltransferase